MAAVLVVVVVRLRSSSENHTSKGSPSRLLVMRTVPFGPVTEVWAAAMFSDSSSPVNWVGKSPGGAIHVS
ncbi:hypothetical protein ACFPRL_01205 [Pseudoclavibacter helvolus]